MIYIESNNTVREYHTSSKIEKVIETLLKAIADYYCETNYKITFKEIDSETIKEYIDKQFDETRYKVDDIKAELTEWHNIKHSSLSDANYQIMLDIIDRHIKGKEQSE